MHELSTQMLEQTQAPVLAPVLFVEVVCNGGNVNMWNGVGNFDWNGITWTGAGNLLSIGSVTETNTVQATATELTLSGIDLALVAVALESLERYLPAKFWLGAIDENFQLVTNPYQFLNGRVDTAKIAQSGDSATIMVNVESRLIAMRNPRVRRYTDLDQRIEHPTDGGFTFVDTIQDAEISFHG